MIVEHLNNFLCIICSNNNHEKLKIVLSEMHYSLFISLAAPGLSCSMWDLFVTAYGI